MLNTFSQQNQRGARARHVARLAACAPKGQGRQETFIPGWQETFIPGCPETFIPGCQETFIPGHQETFVPEHQETFIPDVKRHPSRDVKRRSARDVKRRSARDVKKLSARDGQFLSYLRFIHTPRLPKQPLGGGADVRRAHERPEIFKYSVASLVRPDAERQDESRHHVPRSV